MKTFKIDITKIPNILLEHYLILYYLHTKNNESFNSIWDLVEDKEGTTLSLESQGWIKAVLSDPSEWILRPKLTTLFKTSIIESKSDAKSIFEYFKLIREKYSGKSSRIQFKTVKDFLTTRCKNGLTLEGATAVIDYKFKEWWNTDLQRHLDWQTLFGPKHYALYLGQAEMAEDDKEEKPLNRIL